MTKKQIESLKIGDKVVNLIGDVFELVKVDGILYEFKWVNEGGVPSKGSWIAVPSHLADCKLV